MNDQCRHRRPSEPREHVVVGHPPSPRVKPILNGACLDDVLWREMRAQSLNDALELVWSTDRRTEMQTIVFQVALDLAVGVLRCACDRTHRRQRAWLGSLTLLPEAQKIGMRTWRRVEKNQVRDAIGVACRVFHGQQPAPGVAQKRN